MESAVCVWAAIDRGIDPIEFLEFYRLQCFLENTAQHKSHQRVLRDETSLPSDNVVGLWSSAAAEYPIDRSRYHCLPTR